MMTVSCSPSTFSSLGFSSLLSSQLPPDTSDPPRSKSLMQWVLKKPIQWWRYLILVRKNENKKRENIYMYMYICRRRNLMAFFFSHNYQCFTCTCFYKADPQLPSHLACDPPSPPVPGIQNRQQYFHNIGNDVGNNFHNVLATIFTMLATIFSQCWQQFSLWYQQYFHNA